MDTKVIKMRGYESKKTIIRREHGRLNPYAQINRRTIQNPKLSWKAKGLLAYLLSLPDDWKIHISELPKHCRDGVKATRAAFKELEVEGYITGSRMRDEKGYFLGYEYIVRESGLHKVTSEDVDLVEHWRKKEEAENEFWDTSEKEDKDAWLRFKFKDDSKESVQ